MTSVYCHPIYSNISVFSRCFYLSPSLLCHPQPPFRPLHPGYPLHCSALAPILSRVLMRLVASFENLVFLYLELLCVLLRLSLLRLCWWWWTLAQLSHCIWSWVHWRKQIELCRCILQSTLKIKLHVYNHVSSILQTNSSGTLFAQPV